MTKKYIVYGGYVGDINIKPRFWQYVSAYKVAKCYDINPSECILVEHDDKYSLRGIDKQNYIELFVDSTGKYSYRARLLARRTPKSYDESVSIIKEYDYIVNKGLVDWDSLALVHFVISNLSEEELKLK